jgi:hypothetical protein
MTPCDDLNGIIVLGWFAEGDAGALYERPTIRPQGGHKDIYRYGFIKFPKNQLGANARNLL